MTIGGMCVVELSEKELARIVHFMKNRYGVDLSGKETLVSGRLSNKLVSLGISGYTELMDRVEKNPAGEEATLLINSLTTNHTYFMREKIHFDFLKETALPQMKQMAAATKDLRIWSAAASSGEEAYSIVMTLRDFFGAEAAAWDTKVLATDISTKVLLGAKTGIYRAEQVENLPERWKKQYFKQLKDGNWQISQEMRNEVIFNTFNLMDPFPWRKQFHIVFLRNVMIYFDEKTKIEVLNKIYDYLVPGGYLIIGTTETFNKEDTKYIRVQPSIYRK